MGNIIDIGGKLLSLKPLDITQIGYLARGETETEKLFISESFHPKRQNMFSN